MYLFERGRGREENTRPWSIHHVIVLDDDILDCSAAQERWLGGWNFEDVYLDNTQKFPRSNTYAIRKWM